MTCWRRVAAVRRAIATLPTTLLTTLPTQADALAHAAEMSRAQHQHHALPALEHAVSQAASLEVSREPSQLSYTPSLSQSSQETSQDTIKAEQGVHPYHKLHEAAGGDACGSPAFRALSADADGAPAFSALSSDDCPPPAFR